MRPFLVVLLALLALPAAAQEFCRAEVNATELVVNRDLIETEDGPSLRERVTGWPSNSFDRLRGRVPDCDSATLIAYLAETVSDGEVDGYCLTTDPEQGYLLVPGARDWRGHCAKTTCERVKDAAGGAMAVAGQATDIVTNRDAAGGQSRLGAVLHASGAAILSGSAASLASSLSGVAGGVATALSAPAVAGAAAVSVVAVGGAVYLCSGDDEAG